MHHGMNFHWCGKKNLSFSCTEIGNNSKRTKTSQKEIMQHTTSLHLPHAFLKATPFLGLTLGLLSKFAFSRLKVA